MLTPCAAPPARYAPVDEWLSCTWPSFMAGARLLSSGADPNIIKLASDAFWEKVSGILDFRARLLKASTILASLLAGRAATEVARIKAEATEIFGDAQGNLRLDVLANPPAGRQPRR